MVYPQDGSAGIPDGQFVLVLNRSGSISLTASGAPPSGVLSVTAVPSPIPSPSAATTQTTGFAAYSVPLLQSNTTYTLSDTQGPASACSPGTFRVGSFTTR